MLVKIVKHIVNIFILVIQYTYLLQYQSM